MKIPEWADPSLSADLRIIRSQGENQDLEYMEMFPTNVRDLGKEIAAFATSNSGTIVVGVSDSGDLVGLTEALTTEGRDQLLRRIEGVCRGTIRPAITPTARFAFEEGKVALVISVPRGSQPIYYSHCIPYLRHITESRPAEPHEVIDIVSAWLGASRSTDEEDPTSAFLSRLASILIEVLIYGNESTERQANPWFDRWRAQYGYAASQLRNMAVDSIAIENKLVADLNALAQALDDVTSMRTSPGSGGSLQEVLGKAVQIVERIKGTWIDAAPLSARSLTEISEILLSSSRKLRALVDRADQMMDRGQIDEFKSEASQIGYTLLRFSYYQVNSLRAGLSEELRNIGKRLHLIETFRIHSDGGQSMERMVLATSRCNAELEALVDVLS